MRRTFVTAALTALVAFLSPVVSRAAIQLANGAQTSARPTATNKALRKLQITFDPFNVTSFQLSVEFDATKMQVASLSDIQLIAPYTPVGTPTIDNSLGVVNNIGGSAAVGSTQPGDVDIFSITFTLLPGTSLDDNLQIEIFADQALGDFIAGTDPTNPQSTITTPAILVASAHVLGSFNEFDAQVGGGGGGAVPLPAAFWPGAAGLVLVAAFAWRFRQHVGGPITR
jgi:hypothetical protein